MKREHGSGWNDSTYQLEVRSPQCPSAAAGEREYESGRKGSTYQLIHAHVSAPVPPQASKTDQYFLDSASNVSFFFEEEAFDAGGGLRQAKALSINKIGHGGRPALRAEPGRAW